MSFAAPLPVWTLVLAVGLVLTFAAFAYGRAGLPLSSSQRWILTGLRAAGLLLLLLFLMRPVRVRSEPDTSSAVVPVLLDVSQSMALSDVDGESRLAASKELVGERILPALEGRFNVQLFGFGQDLSPTTVERAAAMAPRSDLRGAIDKVRLRFAGRAIAGVVVVSDGAETPSLTASSESAPPFPVFAVGIGQRTVVSDREVAAVTVGSATLADSLVDLTATVVSRGVAAPFEVRVLQDGRLAQSRTVEPSSDGAPVRETFRVSPKAEAPTRYTVEVAADPSELTPDNNRRSVLVPAAGRPKRLLVVEGGPGFEHSFMKRAFDLDKQLEVDSVTRKGVDARGGQTYLIQARPERSQTLSSGFPSTKAILFGYDGIILANLQGSQLTAEQWSWLGQFVSDRGGGLLVMGADSFGRDGLSKTTLNDVLPLDLADRSGGPTDGGPPLAHRVALTPEGAIHPIMQLAPTPEETRLVWAETIPALGNSVALGAARPAASILAMTAGSSGVARPLVAVQPYGRGRTAIFTGEGAWRWRMRLPSTDRSYDTFWRQFARWLTNESPEPMAVRAPQVDPFERSRVVVEVRTPEHEPVTEAQVTLSVADPAGMTEELSAMLTNPSSGIYTAWWTPRLEGVHRLQAAAEWGENESATASAVTLVGGQSSELADPRQNVDVLERLAEQSGGKVVESADIDRLADLLSDRAPQRQILVQDELWHHPVSWMFLIGCLSAEWILRRRWGLR